MNRRRIGLILGPIAFLITIFLPKLPYMSIAAEKAKVFDLAPQYTLGLLLWIAIWWVTECVPLGATGLLAPLFLSPIGIVEWKSSLQAFMHPIIWIFMGGFILAKMFNKWGLDKRIAYRMEIIYKGNNPMIASFFVSCLPVFILTTTGSITASTSIVYPLVLAYIRSLGFRRGSRYGEATMLALGQAATAGAMFLLISTPPNLFAKYYLENNVSISLTFMDWFIVGTPQAILGLIISWIIVFKIIRPEIKELKIDREKIKRKILEMGPLTIQEKVVLILFIQTLALWMLPGIMLLISNTYPNLDWLYRVIKNILPEAAPVIILMLLSTILSINNKKIIEWNELLQSINWNVVFLFGGGITLGYGLSNSGFAEWLVILITKELNIRLDIWSVTAISALLGFLITYPASNTASSMISVPIATSLAISSGINPLPAVISAALACSISSALPSTTPPMAIVYGSRYIKTWSMFKVGMISDTIRLILLIIIEPYLSIMLCNIKGIPIFIS